MSDNDQTIESINILVVTETDENKIVSEKQKSIRWWVLALLCVLIYSMIYCLDNPSAIQNQLIDEYSLTQEQYALLYSIYSYINMIASFIAGLAIDYFGIYSSTLIFYIMIVFGQTIFVLSTYTSTYPLMLTGRAFVGVGQQTVHVARKWLLFEYFIGKEYYFASAISLSSSRLASASQLYFSTILYETYQLVLIVVSFGWILVILSLILLVIFLYVRKKYRIYTDNKKDVSDNKCFIISLICGGEVDRRWWLLGFTTIFLYACYLSYSNVSAAFLQNRYDFSYEKSNMFAPIMFWICVIFTPIFGILCDVYGKRNIFIFIASVCLLLGHIFLSFIGNANKSIIFPMCGEIFLGIGFSLAAASTWASFGLIVKQKYLANTYGIWGCIENGFQATVYVIVGVLTHNYTAQERENNYDQFEYVRYVWIVLALGAIFWSVLLWYYDAKMFDNILWKPSDKFVSNKDGEMEEK